ncbi:MAG: hypothetical protein JO087_18170 [Actinobacteria bacterium]|nr:hypothetical protein [Actinomycetota bacterium]
MIARLAGVIVYLVVATIVLGYLGVGGYRAGFLWLALAIPVVATALAWRVLRNVDTNTALWCVAVALIGITACAKLVDLAPESTARLAQHLDGLNLPFFKTVRETRSGHGWCRPHCPRVERQYTVPRTAPRAAYFTVLLALRQHHLLDVNERLPDVRAAGERVVTRTDRYTITVTAAPPTARIVLQSR